jgi:isopentenyl-diphosphate delta-isomerase
MLSLGTPNQARGNACAREPLDEVVLVDVLDRPIGRAGKEEAHRFGLLHRAFSVIVYDGAGRMLLQQRALSKYHSGGLWSNTCCSHPRPGEDTEAAAHRRLVEEMGFDCALERVHGFVYRVEVDNGLVEHEYDHVFIGRCDASPRHDPDEVHAWRWIEPRELGRETAVQPQRFSYWFKRCLQEMPALVRTIDQRSSPGFGETARETQIMISLRCSSSSSSASRGGSQP